MKKNRFYVLHRPTANPARDESGRPMEYGEVVGITDEAPTETPKGLALMTVGAGFGEAVAGMLEEAAHVSHICGKPQRVTI